MGKISVFGEEGDMLVTSPFGYRQNPVTAMWEGHEGIDITRFTGCSETATICAFEAGTVVEARDGIAGFDAQRSEGNFVVIKHNGGYASKYFHLACGSVKVKPYARVEAGEAIGYMGNSGCATGAHLHFQLEYGGVPFDPLPYLEKKLSICEAPVADWSRDSVLWAIESGLLNGDQNGRLDLGGVCTREMLCVLLKRLFDLMRSEETKK